MKEKDFLRQLKREAQNQVPLESAHLFSPRAQIISAWFWRHSWQVYLVFSIICAFFFESWQGRCR